MKRRFDSDGITRADRRQETNCRKKVKFTSTDEEDNPSLEHTVFQGEETRDQNRRGHAASVPKTSEYAFFKKLKEERHQKSHLHSLPEEDDRAERFRLTNRLSVNEDSSAAVLRKDVVPAKLPTARAYIPAICVSEKPDFSKTLYKPGEIFSRVRNNLLSWVARSSLSEIGELHSKGYELASVLLSRLTPKGADTLKNSGNLGVKPLVGLLKSRLVSDADVEESYQKPTNWESMDIEDGKYLMDNAFSSGLNKYSDGAISSYKPPTGVAAASKLITCQGGADCVTENLDAVFPDAAYDFSLNLATMEDGFIPLHGLNYKDALWSSGREEPKGDLSMSFADWVLEVGESKSFSSDVCDDLEMLPRLSSWNFDHHRQHENHALDEEDNLFAVSVPSAVSPGLYPSALHAASSQDLDFTARQPRLLDGILPHPSPLSNYSFLAEDCSFRDWVLDETFREKHRQPCPRSMVESFLISSGFDPRCLSPAGLAIPNGTLTRSPYQVPLASIRDGGETETLENSPVGLNGDHWSRLMESPFCLYYDRSSLYFLTISDGEEPRPGLLGILN